MIPARSNLTRPCDPGEGIAPLRAGRAFSLLETSLAVSILGIGLIMVAAVFPVALSQHRGSVYQARATELASKAEAMLKSRVDSNQLCGDDRLLQNRLDSPWYLLTSNNIAMDSGWAPTAARNYADAINETFPSFPSPNPCGNDLLLSESDILAESLAPLNDAQARETPQRLIWTGFYRRLATGSVNYAAAICRQQRDQRFALQSLAPSGQGGFLAESSGVYRRFPVPWRVQVRRWPQGNVLYNNPSPEGLAELAPPGSKLMIHGVVYGDASPLPGGPTGLILTVADVIDLTAVEVREDLSAFPWDDPGDNSDNNISFDVWVFPPPAIGGDAGDTRFGNESPVVDWKVFL